MRGSKLIANEDCLLILGIYIAAHSDKEVAVKTRQVSISSLSFQIE